MFQFLECGQQIRYRSAPAVQPPDQHDIDLPAARRFQRLLASLPLRRAGTYLSYLHRNGPTPPGGIFAHGVALHRKCLLVIRGNAGLQTRPEHFRRFSVPGQKRGRILPFREAVSRSKSLIQRHFSLRTFEESSQKLTLCRRMSLRRSAYQFTVSHCGFVEWLRQHFGHGASEKLIPARALGMPEEFRQSLLDGYLSGDGWQAPLKGMPCAECRTVSKVPFSGDGCSRRRSSSK
jgi:hypothetical protein